MDLIVALAASEQFNILSFVSSPAQYSISNLGLRLKFVKGTQWTKSHNVKRLVIKILNHAPQGWDQTIELKEEIRRVLYGAVTHEKRFTLSRQGEGGEREEIDLQFFLPCWSSGWLQCDPWPRQDRWRISLRDPPAQWWRWSWCRCRYLWSPCWGLQEEFRRERSQGWTPCTRPCWTWAARHWHLWWWWSVLQWSLCWGPRLQCLHADYHVRLVRHRPTQGGESQPVNE